MTTQIKMRAQVLERPGKIETSPLVLKDVDRPHCTADDVCIRVDACGVCRTDLHIVEGDLKMKKTPLILGHQVVGEIVQKGAHVTSFEQGQQVGTPWMRSVCGTCVYCKKGKSNLCVDATCNGYHENGGYAAYMVVPQSALLRLPKTRPPSGWAPLLCAGIIGYRSLKLCEIKPGERLGIYGFGASAHIAIQIARYWGCEVYVVTRSKAHQAHALSLGAAWVGGPTDPLPKPCQSSLLFAPAGEIIPQMLKDLDRGGTIAINAIHMTDIPALTYDDLYFEKTIRSVTNLTAEDGTELIELADKIPIQTKVTEYPLAAANTALLDIKHSTVEGAAVLVN